MYCITLKSLYTSGKNSLLLKETAINLPVFFSACQISRILSNDINNLILAIDFSQTSAKI